MKKEKGYTLVEIIATVSILSIFLVSIPMFISTVINGEKRVSDKIQYSAYVERIEQALEEKDISFFEKMEDKILKFEFSSIEDIYIILNENSTISEQNEFSAKVKIKKANEESKGMYLVNISVYALDDESIEIKREFLIRREIS